MKNIIDRTMASKMFFLLSGILIIVFFASCSQKKTSPDIDNATENNIIKDTLSLNNIDADFKIQKLSTDSYIIYPGDTLILEKPSIDVFEGKCQNKNIKAILIKRMGNESNRYSYFAYVYIEEESQLVNVWFGKEDDTDNYWVSLHSPDEEYPYTFRYDSVSGFILRYNEDLYPLTKVSSRFSAYDKYNYVLKSCPEFELLRYNYSYQFSFKVSDSSGLYKSVFESKSFSDLILGEERADISEWKHDIAEDTMTGLPEDEACYNYGSTSYTEPVYMDSTVFVVLSFEDVYMGGAHGMYSSDYTNYDVKTGRIWNLEDIIDSDSAEFQQILEQSIKKQIFAERDDVPDNIEDLPSTFYILPTGINFIFPMYSLGGGAWEKVVFISFDNLQPCLKINPYL